MKTEKGLEAAREEYSRSKTGPFTVLPVSICYLPVSRTIATETLETILSSSPSDVKPTGHDPFAERDAILQRRFTDRSNELGHVEYIFDLGNWNPFFVPDPSSGKKYCSMLQILQYPFSRGSIHIRRETSNGRDALGLAIDPGYYSGRGARDLEIALHSLKMAEKICATQPLASIIRGQVSPRPEEVRTDADLREWIRQTMVTDWHPVGTCAMGGKAGARVGVVDSRLRVYGVGRLRVVDASIMPVQISAHLQATVYAIAEKGASMILKDLGE